MLVLFHLDIRRISVISLKHTTQAIPITMLLYAVSQVMAFYSSKDGALVEKNVSSLPASESKLRKKIIFWL